MTHEWRPDVKVLSSIRSRSRERWRARLDPMRSEGEGREWTVEEVDKLKAAIINAFVSTSTKADDKTNNINTVNTFK